MSPGDQRRDPARHAGIEDELARERSMQRYLARLDDRELRNTGRAACLVWIWALVLMTLCLGWFLGRELGLL